MKNEIKKELTLEQAANELGLEYNYFRKPKVYMTFCLKNDVKLIKYPGQRKILIERKSFNRLREASFIN